MDVPDNEIIRRRKERKRDLTDESFLKIGLSEYEKYGECQKNLPGVIVINGMKSPDQILEEIILMLKE